ncbi:hypothetical protein Fsol_00403 [Candidatus Fokinia solitaria]|uniref:Uncharacterized protein n=1 Tax=Candidatus Fokinia solitaria TaxID=1802984 RepID=A0A2U8BS78_9RICK|nr:hypothetical protein [Candidatus Fokinia solitaria]AWD33199.1 hypothetical protein Fsol_00403 [Candidatus Fokinia solitaria]
MIYLYYGYSNAKVDRIAINVNVLMYINRVLMLVLGEESKLLIRSISTIQEILASSKIEPEVYALKNRIFEASVFMNILFESRELLGVIIVIGDVIPFPSVFDKYSVICNLINSITNFATIQNMPIGITVIDPKMNEEEVIICSREGVVACLELIKLREENTMLERTTGIKVKTEPEFD